MSSPIITKGVAPVSSSSSKRPSSPNTSSPVSKKVQKVQDFDTDVFEEEFDFDSEALIEATIEAEERASKQHSSQASSSQGGKSSNGAAVAVAKSTLAQSQPDKSTPKASTTLKHGDSMLEKETMDPQWFDRLKGEFEKPSFKKLKTFLQEEAAAGRVTFPPAHLIHSWSRMTPLSTVKVVVVGQDPYHGPGQACGHSFSVPKGVPVPGSLRNIYKELSTEYGASFKAPNHG